MNPSVRYVRRNRAGIRGVPEWFRLPDFTLLTHPFHGGFRMASYIWPIALIVLCNTIYQICSKSVPSSISPLASLTVTYLVSAATACVLYFALNKNASLIQEYRHLNWASFVLGLAVVGLETGFIYAYKAGWTVSTASLVQNAFLAVALVFVGAVLFHESITWNKVVGIAICLVGLAFINH